MRNRTLLNRTCTGLVHLVLAILTASTLSADEREEDKQALRDLAAQYERAVNEDTVALIELHLAEDFSGIMVTSQAVTNFADMTKYWAQIKELLGEGGTYQVKLIPEDSIFDGDLAICRGTTSEVASTSSDKFEFSTLWTAICRKTNGQWKLVRVQGTMDPVGNAFVKTFMSRAATWSGITGAGLGLLCGAVVTYFVTRRTATARVR